jgi:hypothetical protein
MLIRATAGTSGALVLHGAWCLWIDHSAMGCRHDRTQAALLRIPVAAHKAHAGRRGGGGPQGDNA